MTEEDFFHSLTFMSCWELFSPSFYRTHTEEEIEEATEKAMERIGELLEGLRKMEGKEEEKSEDISGRYEALP